MGSSRSGSRSCCPLLYVKSRPSQRTREELGLAGGLDDARQWEPGQPLHWLRSVPYLRSLSPPIPSIRPYDANFLQAERNRGTGSIAEIPCFLLCFCLFFFNAKQALISMTKGRSFACGPDRALPACRKSSAPNFHLSVNSGVKICAGWVRGASYVVYADIGSVK